MESETRDWRWQSGSGASVQIGAVNRNGQRCCGDRGVPGTDYLQLAYKMECTVCGHVYGANGSDAHERLCPQCQGGAPGIVYWKVPLRDDAAAIELRREIEIGIDQAKAGQLTSGADLFNTLRERVRHE